MPGTPFCSTKDCPLHTLKVLTEQPFDLKHWPAYRRFKVRAGPLGGQVTARWYYCFECAGKLNPKVRATWAQILKVRTESRL